MSKPKGPPLWAVDIARRLSRGMSKLQRKMAPPSATLTEIVSGVWRPHAIWLVAELGIADLLADGPRDVADLARDAGADEDALFRVLSPLAHDGILARVGSRGFALTSLSEPLRTDHPRSVRQSVRQSMGRWNREVWSELETVVRTGEPAFARLHGGRDIWTWFAEEAPEAGRIFHEAMAEMTRLITPLVVAAHDFSGYRRILDIGGGHGALLAGILGAYPEPRGGVLDLRDALVGAPEALEKAGLRDRIEIIEGSAFGDIPPGWDAYLMKNILHGLPEPRLHELLNHVREALTPGSSFIAIEMLIPEDPSGTYPARLDLQMLLGAGGRERSATEYRDLFAHHAMRLETVARTASPFAVLVATPT